MRGFCIFLLLLLSACAVPPASAADLTVAVSAGEEAAVLRAAAAAYEKSSGLRVRVEVLSPDDYLDRVYALLLAGKGDYDLVLLPGDALAHWAAYHALRPFAGIADPALLPWLPALTVAGEVYGLPVEPRVEVIWYRTDLAAAAPRSWAEFRAAALAANHPPERYGMALAGSGLEAGSEFAALLPGFGAQVVDPAGSVTLDSAEAAAALDFYAGLFTTDGVAVPGSVDAGRGAVISALGEGRAALGIAPLSAGRRLRDCSASPKACQDGRALLDWAWLPGLDDTQALGSLSAWVMPLRAEHPAAGEAFARWLVSAAGAQVWAQNGGTPANQEVLAGLGDAGAALARVQTFRMALPQAYLNNEMWAALHSAIHAAANGSTPPRQALQTGAAAIEQALRQGGN